MEETNNNEVKKDNVKINTGFTGQKLIILVVSIVAAIIIFLGIANVVASNLLLK
jgi:hypothetical protein